MSSAASSATSIAANVAITAAIAAALQQQRDALLAHFIECQALSPERAIAADSIAPELTPALKYYRDNAVIRGTAGKMLYLDSNALAQLQARMARSGRNGVRVVLVIAALIMLAVAILFGLHG